MDTSERASLPSIQDGTEGSIIRELDELVGGLAAFPPLFRLVVDIAAEVAIGMDATPRQTHGKERRQQPQQRTMRCPLRLGATLSWSTAAKSFSYFLQNIHLFVHFL